MRTNAKKAKSNQGKEKGGLMPRKTEDFHKIPREEFHKILEKILKNDNPAKNSALAYWRQKHKDAIKELRGEGKKFRSDERIKSYKNIDKGLDPLYNAVRRRNFREIMRQKDEIEKWVKSIIEGSQEVGPEAKNIIMEYTVVNLYCLAIAKTMIALLLDPID